MKGRKPWYASTAESVLQGGSEERCFLRLEGHDVGHIWGDEVFNRNWGLFSHANSAEFDLGKVQ